LIDEAHRSGEKKSQKGGYMYALGLVPAWQGYVLASSPKWEILRIHDIWRSQARQPTAPFHSL
jgi:hypothetical protein